MLSLISSSVEETQKLAKKILPSLKNKNLICLYGSLGSGKTTFVQGLAQALGIKRKVISPTFVLLRSYTIKNSHSSATTFQSLIHIDCYRVSSEKDIRSIDLIELLSDPKNLIIIEWAEKIKKILPKERIDIKFKHINENKRKITIIH